MILYLIIHKNVADSMEKGYVYNFLRDDDELQEIKVGYDYLGKKLRQQVGFPPIKDAKPLVAWYKYYGKCQPPEKDNFIVTDASDLICLEIEVPDDKVVLVDVLAYTSLMVGEYIPYSNTLEEIEDELQAYYNMGVVRRAYETRKSWKQVFDVKNSEFIFGVFWDIDPSSIREIIW